MQVQFKSAPPAGAATTPPKRPDGVCDVTIAVDQRAVLGSDQVGPPPDILCLLLRLKYANQCGAASRLNPALRLQVNAVRNTSEVLPLLFDVCVQLVIPEIKKLKL